MSGDEMENVTFCWIAERDSNEQSGIATQYIDIIL